MDKKRFLAFPDVRSETPHFFTNKACARRFPSRVFWLVGTLFVLGLAPLVHFGQTGTSQAGVRRFDPQARILPPPGLRPQLIVGRDATLGKRRPPKHPKLTTLLARLVSAVPQQRGAIPKGQRVAPAAGFSVQALPKGIRDAVRAKRMRINKEAEVQVYIVVAEITEENLQQLQSAGVTVELHVKEQRIVQARVPVTRLEELAALPFVRSVRLPDYGIPLTGSVTTEGDAILNADQVRLLLGVNGTGVRVGVISDGIAGIFDTGCTTCGGVAGGPIETADLPAQDTNGNPTTGSRDATGVLTSTSGGLIAQSFRADNDLEGVLGTKCKSAGAEGTAMLEIVHDLAPGAQLFFANFDTGLEFNTAVNFLAQNTDVLVDDIGFFGLAYDGSNPISANTAAALNNEANPIRGYFNAVGNSARNHYQEDFFDSSVDGSPYTGIPGNLHLFQSTADTSDIFALSPSRSDPVFLCDTSGAGGFCANDPGTFDNVIVVLTWDDAFGASGNDYDLFLIQQSTGIVVAESFDFQDGTQDPVEWFSFTNDTGIDDYFHIVIQNFDNLALVRNFDLFVLSPCGPVPLGPDGENHNYNTIRSSVPAQSDAGGSPVSVISLGAIDQADPLNDDIETFSSNGPTNDGRLKPDASAVDGVVITGAGGFGRPDFFGIRFFGTSAAAPHGAGIAALLLQSAPCLLDGSVGALAEPIARQSLRDLILNNAVDLGAAGPDQVFGFGRIDALASANQTVPITNAGPDQTVAGFTSATGASVMLDGTGSSDPIGCPLTFEWVGDCGIASGPTPTVTCPFGTSTMTLTITNNQVTIPSLDSVQVTVTDFAIGVSPTSATVNRGQSASYTVTVSPQFGSFDPTVSLSCSNLPSLSSCSFSPATLTPGGSDATSTLTVSTTAPSAFLTPPFGPRDDAPFYALWLGLPGLVVVGLTLVGQKPKKVKLGFYLSLSLLLALFVLQVACGGDGGTTPSPPPPRPGTPAGTFNITITGRSGWLVRSTTASLTVQ